MATSSPTTIAADLQRRFTEAAGEFQGLGYAVLRYCKAGESALLSLAATEWPKEQEGFSGHESPRVFITWPWRAVPDGASLGASDAEWRSVLPARFHRSQSPHVAATRDFLILGGNTWEGTFVAEGPEAGGTPAPDALPVATDGAIDNTNDAIMQWNRALGGAIERFEELAAEAIALFPEREPSEQEMAGLLLREGPAYRWIEILFDVLRPTIETKPRWQVDRARERQTTIAYAVLSPPNIFRASVIALGRLAGATAEPAASGETQGTNGEPEAKSGDVAGAQRAVEQSAGAGNALATPGDGPPTGFLGGAPLADALGVLVIRRDAFFKQLERERRKLDGEAWIEAANRRPNAPQYLYLASNPTIREIASQYREPRPR